MPYAAKILASSRILAPISGLDGSMQIDAGFEFLTYGEGDGHREISMAAANSYSIAGSGTQVVDLTALTDPGGAALSALTDVLYFAIKIDGGTAIVDQSASNGWGGLLSGGSDGIKLADGAIFEIKAPKGGYPVAPSSMSVTITAGSAAITATVVVAGH